MNEMGKEEAGRGFCPWKREIWEGKGLNRNLGGGEDWVRLRGA